MECVSIFARTGASAVQARLRAGDYDAADPDARHLKLARQPLPARLRVGVPDVLEFYGDQAASDAFDLALKRLQDQGATLVPINYAPLAQAASLLYESALVAERYAAIRPFFDAHEREVIEPVRSIIAAGRRFSAADVFDAQTRLRALGQTAAAKWRDMDVLLVPTAPTHYTPRSVYRIRLQYPSNYKDYICNPNNLLEVTELSY